MIHSLWVKSFRCLGENRLSFDDSSFMSVIAENNVGKTSILEACYILGNLSSFVTSDISQIVSFECEASYMGIKVLNAESSFNYYLKVDKLGKKYITLNDRVTRQRSDILKLFRANYISSDSLFFLTSQPSFRRLKLDQSLAQFSVTYRKNLATFKRLILQKNKLLKQNPDTTLLKHSNQLIAPLIYEIQKERIQYLKDIEDFINESLYSITFPIKKISLVYQSKFINFTSDQIFDYINTNMYKEKMSLYSLYGPHRDDFLFNVDDRLIKSFYSRGVCRVIAYFFQLGQSIFIQKYTGLPMLLLLDEPFAEIYKNLKHDLIDTIPSGFYKIYTSTQQDEITALQNSQLYAINDGLLCKT